MAKLTMLESNGAYIVYRGNAGVIGTIVKYIQGWAYRPWGDYSTPLIYFRTPTLAFDDTRDRVIEQFDRQLAGEA